jgi:hypothetical protein
MVTMAFATLFIWDNSFTSHGIPNTFHSYLISVSANQVIGAGDKIIKIIPMTKDTPKPEKEGAIIVRKANKNEALDAAFKLLENMECFRGFNKHRCIVENDLIENVPEQSISFKEN